MTTLTTTAATVAPALTGWSVHTLWMLRRLHAARRDPLTGLPTRAAFTRRAIRLLRTGPAVVVLADVNRFKQTNDTFGHAAGDAVLAAVASRLALVARSGAAGRLGGDEFAAVLPAAPDLAPITVETLRAALCQPVDVDGHVLPVSVSVGGAVLTGPHRTSTAAVLSYALRRADEAMYVAKRAHGRTHLVTAADAAPLAETVNGRRAGRRGTYQPTPCQPNGGTSR